MCDTESDLKASPDAVQPYLLAMRMMESWAAAEGWTSATMAASYLAPFIDLPHLTVGFLEAARHAQALLRPEDYGRTWTLRAVLDDVCEPFGAWACRHNQQYGWPTEPAVRYWLQQSIAEYMAPDDTSYVNGMDFIIPAVLLVQEGTYVAAVTAAARQLTAAPGELERYWMLWCVEPLRADECWPVQAALEVRADNLERAVHHVSSVLSAQFGPAGLGWEYGTGEGKLVAQGSFVRTPAAATPEERRVDAPPPPCGGVLPPHFR